MVQVDIPAAYQTIKTKLEAIVARKHYTKTENDNQLAAKQDALVSGTNIKTLNNNSLLGSGNITISGGGSVDNSMSTTSTNALQNKVITNVVKYEITASNYNPNIDSTITITVKALNQLNNAVASHSFTLTLPDGSTTSLTTNSNGVATYSYTCSSFGVCRFSVETFACFIKVQGWKQVGTKTVSGVTYTAKVNGNGLGVMEVSSSSISFASGTSHNTNLSFIADGYKPSGTPAHLTQRSVSNNIIIYLWSNEVGITNTYSSSQTISIWDRIPYFYY